MREQAIRRLKKRRDFHVHLFVYVAVNLVLWGLVGDRHDLRLGFPWPLWVTLGWGLGVVFNAWDVYGRRPITEDEIRREVGNLTPHA